MDDLPGPLRDGRYAVTRLLGEGGQAATFEAVDKKVGRPVAVKRFRVRGAKSWKEVELAEREARVLAALSHPALPRYVEHFEEGGELYLVTEKIEGESLAAIRKRGAPIGEDEVIRFLHDASVVLDYLHGQAPQVIHRDIKPSNVIRRPDGSFALIDFGSVRDKMKPEGGSTVVGTFGYMAPEQFQGRAMPASDVYAAGATALAMLTGKEPEDLPHRGLAIDVEAALGRGRSPALVRALAAMLEPDPDRRADRIAPLLEGLRRPSGASPREGRAPREARAPREGREKQGGAEQDARRGPRLPIPAPPIPPPPPRPPQEPVPGFVVAAISIGLTVAQIAVLLAVQVFVPLLLTLMSIVFGKGMREAAGRVSEAGKAAVSSIGRARDATLGRLKDEGGEAARSAEASAPPRRARVAEVDREGSGPRADERRRVTSPGEEAAAEAERRAQQAEEEAAAEERAAKRKRRV